MTPLHYTIELDILTRTLNAEFGKFGADDSSTPDPFADGSTYQYSFTDVPQSEFGRHRELCIAFDDDDVPYFVLLVEVPQNVPDEEWLTDLMNALGRSDGITRIHFPLSPELDCS